MNEGYLPLYRKYRPQKLEDIVGQSHIKKSLINAIQLNKIAHAYLFTGPRGTGKTSTARILAKSLNCKNGPTITPCEECESCKAITNTIPIDVIEIDAASNNKVDDAHEILEKVNYAPVNGKYKIYIIDEVHMLTQGAFNALLKTLEEPPENVIFILATTESHKVLDTIKSRCQRYDFKRITTSDIIEHLKNIAKKENINISDSALSLIAKSSCGGMRDSLALLDQVSILGNTREITEEDINTLLGRISFDRLFELASYIINSDSSSAINILEQIYDNGNEPVQILENVMFFFKNLLIIKSSNEKLSKEITDLTDSQISLMKGLSDNLETHQIVSLINKSVNYIKELKDNTNQELWLEVSVIDLANLVENTKLADLEQRLSLLEGNTGDVVRKMPLKKPVNIGVNIPIETKPSVDSGVKNNVVKNENNEETVVKNKIEVKTPSESTESPLDLTKINNLDNLWVTVLQNLLKDNISGLASMKAFTMLTKCDETGIEIVCKTPTYADKLNLPEKRKILTEAVYSVIGKNDIPVVIRAKNGNDIEIKKIKSTKPKPVSVIPDNLPDKDEDYSEEIAEIIDSANKNEEHTNNEKSLSDVNDALSEQSAMVKNIFDGKIIE